MNKGLIGAICTVAIVLAGCAVTSKSASIPQEPVTTTSEVSTSSSQEGPADPKDDSKESVSADPNLRIQDGYWFMQQIVDQINDRVEKDVNRYGHLETSQWFSDVILPQVQLLKEQMSNEHDPKEDKELRRMVEVQLDRLEFSIRDFSSAFAQKSDDGYAEAMENFQKIKENQSKIGQKLATIQNRR
ncbi:hypothetical protein H1S01_10205 [Heliobacterium chlorum]|uniref:Lipoprotein n=1 Tax=Heliobacterium chlorum TaxID=2698 RepID=A0ABR7T5R8_HELCL|nr:hypothetical protein [Heliobacterium chlorum]MBC9784881.1 hypothetical protein [Heliobacterium chlorum]